MSFFFKKRLPSTSCIKAGGLQTVNCNAFFQMKRRRRIAQQYVFESVLQQKGKINSMDSSRYAETEKFVNLPQSKGNSIALGQQKVNNLGLKNWLSIGRQKIAT
ncbi:hypothetical protein TNCV_1099551 [Trichonephila clavipes]|nr:hypothetical protein TNCV_1099551 [Trichonephila clavipes]